jgi:hypothetical protein
MTASQDQELQEWVKTWQTPLASPTHADELGARVRRHVRTRRLWAATEAAIGIAAFAVMSYRVVVEETMFEKVAMALLGLIALGAVALSWWQWRGIWRASAETTTAFLAGCVERGLRLQRYVAAGWVILIAEVAVFVPWIHYRLETSAEPASPSVQWFAWGLLALMTALAVVFLVVMQRWLRREQEALAEIQREVNGE